MDTQILRPSLSELLIFLQSYIAEHGFAPSYDDIVEGTSSASKAAVSYNLKDLEEKGFIRRMPRTPRSIQILRPLPLKTGDRATTRRRRAIPLLGRISAGAPIEVPGLENREYIGSERIMVDENLLPRKYAGRELFALKVQGDSMIDAGVLNGDLIVVEAVSQVDNGDMAVVWFPEPGETTLKYFYKNGDQVRLKPANESLKEMVYEAKTIRIQGRLVMTLRVY